MRATALVSVLLGCLTFAPPGEAQLQQEIDFQPPAQVGPELDASTSWVLVLLGNGTLNGSVALGAATYAEHQEVGAIVRYGPNAMVPGWAAGPPRRQELAGFDAGIVDRGPLASVYIEAASISWQVKEAPSTIGQKIESAALDFYVGDDVEAGRSARFSELRPAGGIILAADQPGNIPFELEANQVSAVEFHGVAFDCGLNGATVCPDGNDRETSENHAADAGLETQLLRFHRFEGGDGSLKVRGVASSFLGGGSSVDATVLGSARFPLATCDACSDLHQQTLALEGTIELQDLNEGAGGRFSALLAGSIDQARIDEEAVDPSALGVMPVLATTAVTASALVVLKLLLAPLFTRLSKEQALEHPRRKQIFEYIQQHPGANFREVARNTGIAAGTVRHHLNVLERSGQVVEHSHGSTVRLFENHGKFDHNWSDLVLLREPALGKLHDWLKEHPNSPQKAVLEAMEKEAWSRSTTQHRLSRLVDGGVASIRLQGRLKMYTVIERPAAKAAGLPASPRAFPA